MNQQHHTLLDSIRHLERAAEGRRTAQRDLLAAIDALADLICSNARTGDQVEIRVEQLSARTYRIVRPCEGTNPNLPGKAIRAVIPGKEPGTAEDRGLIGEWDAEELWFEWQAPLAEQRIFALHAAEIVKGFAEVAAAARDANRAATESAKTARV